MQGVNLHSPVLSPKACLPELLSECSQWLVDSPFPKPAGRLTTSLVCNSRYTHQRINEVTPALLTPVTALAGVVSVSALRVRGDVPRVKRLSLTPFLRLRNHDVGRRVSTSP